LLYFYNKLARQIT